MAGSFTISIPSLSTLLIGSSKRAEASEIMWMADNALRQAVASGASFVSFNDRQGAAAGTLAWTPVNMPNNFTLPLDFGLVSGSVLQTGDWGIVTDGFLSAAIDLGSGIP